MAPTIMLFLTLLSSAHELAQTRRVRVPVQIFMEAACPYCNKYLAGPLSSALADSEVAATMDVDVSPFGNAFYITQRCQAAANSSHQIGQYDTGVRDCFFKTCGAGVAQRPSDCFSGQLVCQHGAKECAFNRYFACAKSSNAEVQSYLPFIKCMEAGYAKSSSEPGEALLTSCAESAGLAPAELQSCYHGSAGDDALRREAMATPVHVGVPLVLVNGKPSEEGYEDDVLIKAVRDVAKSPRSASFLAVAAHTEATK